MRKNNSILFKRKKSCFPHFPLHSSYSPTHLYLFKALTLTFPCSWWVGSTEMPFCDTEQPARYAVRSVCYLGSEYTTTHYKRIARAFTVTPIKIKAGTHVSSPLATPRRRNSSHMARIGEQTSDTLATLAHYFYTHCLRPTNSKDVYTQARAHTLTGTVHSRRLQWVALRMTELVTHSPIAALILREEEERVKMMMDDNVFLLSLVRKVVSVSRLRLFPYIFLICYLERKKCPSSVWVCLAQSTVMFWNKHEGYWLPLPQSLCSSCKSHSYRWGCKNLADVLKYHIQTNLANSHQVDFFFFLFKWDFPSSTVLLPPSGSAFHKSVPPPRSLPPSSYPAGRLFKRRPWPRTSVHIRASTIC